VTVRNLPLHPFARRLAALCNGLYQRGLSPGQSGNVSARDEGLLWITPRGQGLGEVRPASLVVIWPDGRTLAEPGLAPSSELQLHQAIYQARPDVQAIVHVHSPKATTMAVLRQPLEAPILTEMLGMVDAVPVVPMHPPGTSELAMAAANALQAANAVLLANHGVIATGRTLEEAGANLELVESYAEIYLLSQPMGGATVLTAAEVAAIRKNTADL
jgi:ribulose-5-phosphate 4-epimerase/fuculose-1-phosphate aldolase